MWSSKDIRYDLYLTLNDPRRQVSGDSLSYASQPEYVHYVNPAPLSGLGPYSWADSMSGTSQEVRRQPSASAAAWPNKVRSHGLMPSSPFVSFDSHGGPSRTKDHPMTVGGSALASFVLRSMTATVLYTVTEKLLNAVALTLNSIFLFLTLSFEAILDVHCHFRHKRPRVRPT